MIIKKEFKKNFLFQEFKSYFVYYKSFLNFNISVQNLLKLIILNFDINIQNLFKIIHNKKFNDYCLKLFIIKV